MIMTLLDWIEGYSDSRTPGENSSPTPLKHLHEGVDVGRARSLAGVLPSA